MGGYAKSGSAAINGVLKLGDRAPSGGRYLLDVLPDGELRFRFSNISVKCRYRQTNLLESSYNTLQNEPGSVLGSASLVVRSCADPETHRRTFKYMDVDLGGILAATASSEHVGDEICDLVFEVASGTCTIAEKLGHQEVTLTCKAVDPICPACLPLSWRT